MSVRNFFALTNPGDVTTGTTGTTPSTPIGNGGGQLMMCVHMRLIGGTTATGRAEGSMDGGLSWGTLQGADFSLTTNGAALQQLTTTAQLIRFNPLTNVGGGTIVALWG